MTADTHDERLDPVGRPLQPKDAARLKRPVFKTRVAPLHEETVDMLRGWREPNRPYVLYERPQAQITSEGGPRALTYSIFVFSVDARPEQWNKFDSFERKGFRLLHWGRFYYIDEKNKERAARANAYGNAWGTLDEYLSRKVNNPNGAADVAALKEEKSALEAKLKEYEEREAQRAQAGQAAPKKKDGA